ncbi:MAG: DUF1697 domain-containing protein [Acidimicrobiales bacterium]
MAERLVVMMRGINVGGAKKVPMAELRAALTDAGCTGMSTILATGNVILDGDDPEAAATKVEQLVLERFEVATRCLARTAAEIDGVIAGDPFADVATNGSRYLAVFLSENLPDEVVADDGPIDLDADGVALGDRLIYQWCPDGILAAEPIGDAVMKHTDLFVTARNWNTLLKIQARLDSN